MNKEIAYWFILLVIIIASAWIVLTQRRHQSEREWRERYYEESCVIKEIKIKCYSERYYPQGFFGNLKEVHDSHYEYRYSDKYGSDQIIISICISKDTSLGYDLYENSTNQFKDVDSRGISMCIRKHETKYSVIGKIFADGKYIYVIAHAFREGMQLVKYEEMRDFVETSLLDYKEID